MLLHTTLMATRPAKRHLTIADLAAEVELPPETVRTILHSFAGGTSYSILARWLGVPIEVLGRLRERCPYFVEKRLLMDGLDVRPVAKSPSPMARPATLDASLVQQVRRLKKVGVNRRDAQLYLQMGPEFSAYWRRATQQRVVRPHDTAQDP